MQKPNNALSRLSPVQRVVLRGLAQGKKLEAIVDDLPPERRVSVHGIRWHCEQIYRKLEIHSVQEATVLAVKFGLL